MSVQSVRPFLWSKLTCSHGESPPCLPQRSLAGRRPSAISPTDCKLVECWWTHSWCWAPEPKSLDRCPQLETRSTQLQAKWGEQTPPSEQRTLFQLFSDRPWSATRHQTVLRPSWSGLSDSRGSHHRIWAMRKSYTRSTRWKLELLALRIHWAPDPQEHRPHTLGSVWLLSESLLDRLRPFLEELATSDRLDWEDPSPT